MRSPRHLTLVVDNAPREPREDASGAAWLDRMTTAARTSQTFEARVQSLADKLVDASLVLAFGDAPDVERAKLACCALAVAGLQLAYVGRKDLEAAGFDDDLRKDLEARGRRHIETRRLNAIADEADKT